MLTKLHGCASFFSKRQLKFPQGLKFNFRCICQILTINMGKFSKESSCWQAIKQLNFILSFLLQAMRWTSHAKSFYEKFKIFFSSAF